MAGGIFTGRPFEPNIKCILFGAVLMSLYYFAPAPEKKNSYIVLPMIFVAGYISLAWYDYAYNCEPKMKSGNSPLGLSVIDSNFKPQYDPDCSQKQLYQRNVYIFHALIIAPLLIYVGFKGKETPDGIYTLVAGLGLTALFYHGYRVVHPRIVCGSN